MILSHERRFIFLRTRKVGGTSVEIGLSDLCGPADVITPMGPGPEKERIGRLRGPQNYELPEAARPLLGRLLVRLGVSERKAGVKLYNHMPAAEVRRLFPREFRDYLKVSIERNPWDREVSFYNYRFPAATPDRPSFEDFVLRRSFSKTLKNFEIYSIGGRVVADVVMRYESLADDYAAVCRRLGVDEPPPLPSARSRPRADKTGYRELYTPAMRDAVAKLYRREIEAFGYEF